MSRTVHLNLTQVKKQAKELLQAHHSGDPIAVPVLRRLPRLASASAKEILAAEVSLSDVQFAMARDLGFESWPQAKRYIEGQEPRPRAALKKENEAAWITQVPQLGWGLGRNCTFIGSLEAALAATDDPWSYADLMGFSGLAFRVRWSPDFCPSCAVGEMPDESTGIRQCTGWALPADIQFGQDHPDREPIRRRLVKSIDAGLPVLAYGICLDMAVVYGYEGDGNTLWLTDYHARGEMPYKLPLQKLGPLQIYLTKENGSLSPAGQVRQSLSLAVLNWRRAEHDAGIRGRKYLYGPTAYDAWLDAVRQSDHLPEEQMKQLLHTHKFACLTLADARQAAALFLKNSTESASAKAAALFTDGMQVCSSAAKQLRSALDTEGLFSSSPGKWSADIRQRESAVIEGMKHQDAQLHKVLRQILNDLEHEES